MTTFVPLLSLFSTLVLSPAPVTLGVAGSLQIEAQYMEQGARAPHTGLLLTLGDFALLRSEIRQCDESCSTRVAALQDECSRTLDAQQESCRAQHEGYLERIAEMETLTMQLQTDLDRVESRYKSFRIISYSVAGVSLASLIYGVLR